MIQLLLRNKPLSLFLGFLILCGLGVMIIGIYIFLPSSPAKNTKEEKKLSTQLAKYPAVLAITPKDYVQLIPGKQQEFIINFHDQIDVTKLQTSLNANSYTKDSSPQRVEITTSFEKKNQMIRIKTNTSIVPLHSYTLMVTNPISKQLMLRATYHSTDVMPTAIPTNSQTLRKFLPHVTDNYSLVFNEKQNLYIFHFKIIPTSSQSLSEQFAIAKNDAMKFIQSKNISINSIVIDWRNY